MELAGLSACALAKARTFRYLERARGAVDFTGNRGGTLSPNLAHPMATGLTCSRTLIWRWLKARSAGGQLGSARILTARTVRCCASERDSGGRGTRLASNDQECTEESRWMRRANRINQVSRRLSTFGLQVRIRPDAALEHI